MKTTVDRVARGELLLEQPADGYRFNADAVLLARFAEGALGGQQVRSVVDLGAGCGVIGLLLARRLTEARVLLIELQDELAELARRNVERNGLVARVTVRREDLRAGAWREQVSSSALLVCNPPFFRVGEGRLSPKPFAARARHELALPLAELVGAAAPALDEGSRLAMVYPASREGELLELLAGEGLALRRRRAICAFPGAPASRLLLLVERGSAGGEVQELEPLYERGLDGRVSEERG